MKVSVIIPCRNGAPYLAQAIGSALDQTRPPHEVIVVDDGSTDGSLPLARLFEACVPDRVRVLSVAFGRASRARNLGALIATGDSLMFLDADDVLGRDALEALTDALARLPAGIAVCPWFRLAFREERWVKQPPSCVPRSPGQDALRAWLTGWYHPPCSTLWSRSAFERAGRWDEQAIVNQDGDLIMRALASGITLLEASKGTAYYRRHPDGQTSLSGSRFTREGLAARIRIIAKIAYLLQDQQRLRPYRESIGIAFGRIAADAAERHTDLCEQARACARHYGPALGARAIRRMLPRPRAVRRAGAAREPFEEVRCGLDRAEQVRHAEPPSAASPLLSARCRQRPTVTVIVPTYNRAHLIPRAIRSVLAQTYGDFELLVIDDGSSDDTQAVVAGWSDPRVRYLREPQNAGVGAARNRGLREARGEFIAFLDSDDEWLPDKLSRQVALFRAVPDAVGLIYTGVESVYADQNQQVASSGARGDLYREMLQRNVIHGGGSNVMIRREVVATAGFFHEGIPAIEDYEYWLRITRFFKVEFIGDPLVRYYDASAGERRSLAREANLEARWWFFRTHLAEMRRAGVAHLFLLKTARWALNAPRPDRRAARRLAARAVIEAPTSRTALEMLARTVLPSTGLRLLARRRPAARPLRVLLCSRVQPRDRGGVQAVMARLVTHLRGRGHHVVKAWVVGHPYQAAGEATFVAPHLNWRRGVPTPRSTAGACLALVRLCASLAWYRPQIVNFHYVTRESAYFLLLKRLFRYKIVLSVHGSDVLRPKPDDAAVLGRVLRHADAVTAVSRLTADAVRQRPGVDRARVRLIPNGVDVAFWSARTSQPDRRPTSPTVLAVGRLHPVKGHDVLLRAFPRVLSRIPNARLLVIGGGGFRTELEHLAEQLVPEVVEFAGELEPEAVRARMAEARAFVLPSRSEGLPLTLLEAMAAGLPVVASRVGGVPEVVVPGTGVLVPPEDPTALADGLAEVLLCPEKADELIRNAKERARQFSAAAADTAYEDLFLALAHGCPRPVEVPVQECVTVRKESCGSA